MSVCVCMCMCIYIYIYAHMAVEGVFCLCAKVPREAPSIYGYRVSRPDLRGSQRRGGSTARVRNPVDTA